MVIRVFKPLWLVVLAALVFTQCGNGNNYEYEPEALALPPVITYEAEFPTTMPEEPAYCIFLADFDYMMQLMEDTFPFFDMVYRMYGIDIRAQGEIAREIVVNYPYSLMEFAYSVGMTIEDMPEMDEYVLWSILAHDFFGHFRFAHSRVYGIDMFNALAPFVRHFTATPLARFNRQAFINPASDQFYRELQDLMNAPVEDNLAIRQILARRDLRPTDDSAPAAQGGQAAPPTLITKSIEEGRIAYMEVTSFLVNIHRYSAALTSFYTDIQGYEHLIIDIRRNGGGQLEFARGLIMHALVPDRDNLPDMPLYVLYRDSEMGGYLGEIHIESHPRIGTQFVRQSEYLIPISELIERGSLVYLSEDDLQNLAYGFRVNTSLEHNNRRPDMPHTPFHGQIWLLTSERNVSSSAMFARQAKYMDFATLVGETVSGHYTATYMVYFYLPNTGIIVQWDVDYLTDEVGHALNEFTTTPHYFNRDGLCALETVLAMIAEKDTQQRTVE